MAWKIANVRNRPRDYFVLLLVHAKWIIHGHGFKKILSLLLLILKWKQAASAGYMFLHIHGENMYHSYVNSIDTNGLWFSSFHRNVKNICKSFFFFGKHVPFYNKPHAQTITPFLTFSKIMKIDAGKQHRNKK